MKSLFEEMGVTYRQEGDYLIPNLSLPEEPEYQIGKYGCMRRSYRGLLVVGLVLVVGIDNLAPQF